MKVGATKSSEGAKILRLRRKADMSQESLARMVGVTTHTIWRLENGPTFNPRLETLRALAKALGVRLRDILDV